MQEMQDVSLIPRLERSPGVANGNPLQYSCLDNPMNRGAWQATVHGVTKSQVWLGNWAHTLIVKASLWFLLIPNNWVVVYIHSVISVAQSCLDSLRPHGLQHARLPCPSLTPGACSNSCPLIWWCHPTSLFSVVPFFCLQYFPTSESFPVSQFIASGDQSIGVSASTSVLSMSSQDWFPLELTDWISLQSKGLSRVFSNTTVQKHQFFSAQLSL